MRDFQLPGRSPIRVTEAAAATSQPLATLTAIETLRRGGNAIDAAVAAAAVLAVVEPESTGIGGDGFMLYAPGGGIEGDRLQRLGPFAQGRDDRLVSRAGLHRDPDVRRPMPSPSRALVDAWARITADHGTRGLDELLQPAIHYAEKGFVVHDRVAFDWARAAERLARDPNAARILLPQGRAPRAGERFRQPELAPDLAHHRGQGARRLLSRPDRRGDGEPISTASAASIRLDDFAELNGAYVQPIHGRYRGVDVYQMPPNNQGLTALLMLNILSGFELRRPGRLRGRAAASADRGGAAGLSRPQCADRRSRPCRCAGGCPALHGLRRQAAGQDRSGPRHDQSAGPAAAALGHDLSHGRRSRPQCRQLHQLGLSFLRQRDGHRQERHLAAEPRRQLPPGSQAPQCDRRRASGRCTPSCRAWRCATARR